MKNILVAVAVLLVVVGVASAQPGKISFGVGVDVGLPMGTFGDTQSLCIGGTAKVYYPLQDMITLTGTAGYMTFSGKEYTVGTAKVKAGSWNMVPVVVGGRYYFGPAGATRFYAGFDMGLIFGSYTVPSQTFFGVTVGGGSVSTTDFTYQPQVGVEAGKFDIAVRLLGVANANTIAARVGYIFN